MVPVKVSHNSKAILFEMETSTSLYLLQRKIRAMFKIKIKESFDVYWIDDDNGRIMLDSEELLKIVLKIFQKQKNPFSIMKLNIIIQRHSALKSEKVQFREAGLFGFASKAKIDVFRFF